MEDGEGIKGWVALGKKGVGGSEGSEDDSGLGFFFDGFGEDIEGSRDGIEPTATRRGGGREIGALKHQAKESMRAMGEQTQRWDRAELSLPRIERLLGEQVGVEIAPRLTRCLIAAKQRERLEGRDLLKRAVICEQEFATPKLSVGAVSKAVESDAKQRWSRKRALVFGHARGDVGVMVLDAMYREVVFFGECVSVLCGDVLGMFVDGDHGWLVREKCGEFV